MRAGQTDGSVRVLLEGVAVEVPQLHRPQVSREEWGSEFNSRGRVLCRERKNTTNE